jgi:hypothetical protein
MEGDVLSLTRYEVAPSRSGLHVAPGLQPGSSAWDWQLGLHTISAVNPCHPEGVALHLNLRERHYIRYAFQGGFHAGACDPCRIFAPISVNAPTNGYSNGVLHSPLRTGFNQTYQATASAESELRRMRS